MQRMQTRNIIEYFILALAHAADEGVSAYICVPFVFV